MEGKIKMITPQTTFKQFFLRFWLWNLLLSLLLLIMLPVLFSTIVLSSGSEQDFQVLGNSVLAIAVVHSCILLIATIVKLLKKKWLQGILLFVHFIVAGVLAYYLWGMYVLLRAV